MKICSFCLTEKGFNEFYTDKSKTGGYSSQCKVCRKAKDKSYRDRPEVQKATRKRAKNWYKNNTERARAYGKANAESPIKRMLRKYSISEYEYSLLLLAQDEKCAVCKSPNGNRKGGRLVVDHCHETGHVRGLLCHSCNRGIGMLRDSAEILKAALKYLEETQNVRI